ncbi:CoA transferase subunit A [Pelotomaculum propionicicum]|uniref:CoA transferase subunit A n=1 Tax=Pelotomaculum propionicicum TaxID=258475 RepID=UPI003B7E5E0F
MHSKLMPLSSAVSLIKDSQTLAVGGSSLHRTPAAFCHKLAAMNKTALKIVSVFPGYAADVLCAADCVDTVYFSFFGFENEFGLAPGFRKGCQEGKIKAIEGSCISIIAALRAGASGVPFMPVGGLLKSELLDMRPDFFQVMTSPFNGEKVAAVKALVPDWAIIHVQEADEFGNARIIGSGFQDGLLARAARKTIITAERIVDNESFRRNPELTAVPYFLVEAVSLSPQGAKPGICFNEYEIADAGMLKAYTKAVKEGTLNQYLTGDLEGRG